MGCYTSPLIGRSDFLYLTDYIPVAGQLVSCSRAATNLQLGRYRLVAGRIQGCSWADASGQSGKYRLAAG
ncbi:hypothetical protein [Bacteroides helcogenes]|uniref:hypothetical protein n=1 Tax=Bacteroides helcogenes TaxID=290053 RepID=UPI0011D28B40|nr:hypothetical protein [Bacteroides helcogenes]MDY5238729.1 hypothetical protein [Bacteroides helcogenes]